MALKNLSIPPHLAYKLKELGFDEECFAIYQGDHWEPRYKSRNSQKLGRKMGNRNNGFCTAPTWDQVWKFFRDTHNLLHIIDGIHSTEAFEFDCQILNLKNGTYYVLSYAGNDYLMAQTACLERLFEITEDILKNG